MHWQRVCPDVLQLRYHADERRFIGVLRKELFRRVGVAKPARKFDLTCQFT